MEKRSKGIGGTDISAIVGLNPWRSAMDVYMEKTGLVEPQPDTEALYWGRELEPAVLKRYAKETRLIWKDESTPKDILLIQATTEK